MNYLLYIDIGLFILILVLIFIIIKMNKRINLLTNNTDADNIESLIIDYYNDVNFLKEENKDLLDKINRNYEWLTKTICKYDIVRYNPLEEVGGELSFVLTCLDSSNSGFVLNSIYSHNFSQVYLKPVENGFSDIKLSYEEMESLKRAINKIV